MIRRIRSFQKVDFFKLIEINQLCVHPSGTIMEYLESTISLISHTQNCILVHNTPQYLFVIGAKPFPANQNVKYECLHCAFQIYHIFAGSVYQFTTIPIILLISDHSQFGTGFSHQPKQSVSFIGSPYIRTHLHTCTSIHTLLHSYLHA